MFHHTHPYEPFIPKNSTKLIVGTLPPPRFTVGELKPDDVNFCYGSRDGLLWPILDRLFDLNLKYENTQAAVDQRKQFLIKRGIGICDVVQSSRRIKIDASDLGMKEVELRDLIGVLRKNPFIKTLLFTGGNSKNGPEYFFRRHLREGEEGIKLKAISDEVPRTHQFLLDGRLINTVSLTAPSGSANRAIGSMDSYKMHKLKNPEFNTIDFRILQYKGYF
jgi:G:T/U-mismatch repair DNA glycosylase